MKQPTLIKLKDERPILDFPVYVSVDKQDRKIAILRFNIKENKMFWEDSHKQNYNFEHFMYWHDLPRDEVQKWYESR